MIEDEDDYDVVTIGGKDYLISELSKEVLEKINKVAATSQALKLFAALLNHAEYGMKVDLNDAIKLVAGKDSEAPSSSQSPDVSDTKH
jgi:hypothetical protein